MIGLYPVVVVACAKTTGVGTVNSVMAGRQQGRPSLSGRADRYGLLFAVLGTWSCNFLWVGAAKGLAVLLPTLRDQMATQTWVIGWMIAIMEATSDLVGKH